MRAIDSLYLAALLHALPAAAQPTLPDPTTLRYDEDWSVLSDKGVAAAADPLESRKFVTLDEDGSAYLVIGAEIRARSENYANNLTSDPEPVDDSYLWLRTMPYADLHIGKARAFVQPIAAYARGVEPAAGPVDRTGLDLLQGFGEVIFGPSNRFALRAGRQLVSLGSERLVGTRYGPNVPRAFDGVRLNVSDGTGRFSLLWARPVAPGPDDFDDRSSRTRSLWSAYATLVAGPGEADVYYIGARNDTAVWDTAGGGETRHTLGLRGFGARDGWSWNVEGMVQIGHIGEQRIRAWSVASEFERTFADAPLSPGIVLKFNIASGDSNREDRTLGTFDALYPKGQYFGELTPIGPYNMINAHIGTNIQPSRDVVIGVSASDYWRHRRADGVYDVPGGLLRSGDLGTGRHVGAQVEMTVDWQLTRHVAVSVSVSEFRPGRFLRETGFTQDIGMAAFEVAHVF